MFSIGLGHYLTLAAIIFTIGIVGIFLNRKNVIVILMSIELILLAVNINLVSFSIFINDLSGQIFTLFILTVAAAEAVKATGKPEAPSDAPNPTAEEHKGIQEAMGSAAGTVRPSNPAPAANNPHGRRDTACTPQVAPPAPAVCTVARS